MLMTRQEILTPLLAILLLVVSVLPNHAAVSEDCAQILNNRCQECHAKARICQALKKKNENGWKRTVQLMIKKGARLSEDERLQLLQCLSQKNPAVLAFCNDTIVK